MRAKPDGLLGLFLLYFFKYDFFNTNFDAEGLVQSSFRDTLSLAGFPIDVQTLACGFIFLRVFLEMLQSPNTFRLKFPRIIIFLWVAAFIPVLIGTYLGYQDNASNWTRPLRWMMIAGSYFYGHILVKNWSRGDNSLIISILIPLTTIMLLLLNLNVYFSHHAFLFLGIGGAFSIYYIQKKFIKHKLLGIFLLYLSFSHALDLVGTFTQIGIVIFSLIFSFLATRRPLFSSKIKKRFIKFIGINAIVGMLLFPIGVIIIGSQSNELLSASTLTYDEDFQGRVEAKILADRLIFWSGAMEQIIEGPHFIVPSGRPILLETYGLPSEWDVGAHNVVLESLRIGGLFSGTIILIIYLLALKSNLIVLRKASDPIIKCLAASVLGVAIVGMASGDFPADMTVGPWIWILAGLCYGLFLRSNSTSPNIREAVS